jgi:type IV pilus assembly protein PilB
MTVSIFAVSVVMVFYGLRYMKQFGAVSSGLTKEDLADGSPYSTVTDMIIRQGINENADGVILEQKKDELFVINRFGEELRGVMRPPIHLKVPIFSRLKLLAGLDYTITEPSRGQIRFNHNDKVYELEFNSMPSDYGEKVEIRIKGG